MPDPVKRRHRARYGIDYSIREIDLGPVTLELETDNVTQRVSTVTESLRDDYEVMSEVADRMVTFVRENIATGDFIQVLPETLERRKHPFHPKKGKGGGGREATGSTRPLMASGRLHDGIEPRSKAGYAAAQRGKYEWYGFLHDLGVGRLDRRTFMELTRRQADQIVVIYDEWLGAVVEED